MKKPIIMNRYDKSALGKKEYEANKTSLSNLEFCMNVTDQHLAGKRIKQISEELGVDRAGVSEMMNKFLRLTSAGNAFKRSDKVVTGPLRGDVVREKVMADIAELRAYFKFEREGATMPPETVPEPSSRWSPGLAKTIAATANVRHILGGGDKDRVQIEQMIMVKRFALGEEAHDLAESYGIGIGSVRTRLERGWKQMNTGIEFDTKFMREYPQETRLAADNAIFKKLNHIKIEALSDSQVQVTEMRANLNELVQQKAMIEAELNSQYQELCQANIEKEDVLLQMQTVSGQLAGMKNAFDTIQAQLNGARSENSELKRRLEASQLAQLNAKPVKASHQHTASKSRPPRSIFARIYQALTH